MIALFVVCVTEKSPANTHRTPIRSPFWLSREHLPIMTPKPAVWVSRWVMFRFFIFKGSIWWRYKTHIFFIICTPDTDVTKNLLVKENFCGSPEKNLFTLGKFNFVKVHCKAIFENSTDINLFWAICLHFRVMILDCAHQRRGTVGTRYC